jgi:hypothetical protein
VGSARSSSAGLSSRLPSQLGHRRHRYDNLLRTRSVPGLTYLADVLRPELGLINHMIDGLAAQAVKVTPRRPLR